VPKRIRTEEEISALSDRLTQDSADIGDAFPNQIEISRSDKKNLTEQQPAKRKNDQKTAGENRKKKRAALRETAKTAPQAAVPPSAALPVRTPPQASDSFSSVF
jgi:hypothetical protein